MGAKLFWLSSLQPVLSPSCVFFVFFVFTGLTTDCLSMVGIDSLGISLFTLVYLLLKLFHPTS